MTLRRLLSCISVCTAIVSSGCLPQPSSNACATNNGGCSVNANCTVNATNQVMCSCKGGFVGNGMTCTAETSGPCATNNGGCDSHATCTSSNGTAVCTCESGYTGNGKTCTHTSGNACSPDPCDPHATCGVTPDGGARCTCVSGFTGDGFTCVPESGDACSPDPCGAHASCSTGAQGQAICTCDQGYTGDGMTCVATQGQDAGVFRDAGSTGQDAGPDPNAIGGACVLNGTTCDTGLTCFSVSDQNMCSQNCSQDSDCATGEINGMAGICNQGICFPGCNANVANPCGRSDFACLPYDSTRSICLPNCGQQEASFCNDFFGYPFTQCSTSDGSCFDEAACSASMACTSGQVCDTVGSGSSASSLCVDSCAGTPSVACTANTDCPLSACQSGKCQLCPFGWTCDKAGHIDGGTLDTCSPTYVKDYGLCESQAQCTQPANTSLAEYCVAFQAPPDAGPPTKNLCLQTCSQTSDCPAHETCTISLGSINVCGHPCGTDGGTACPTGTTCQTLGGIGKYCAP